MNSKINLLEQDNKNLDQNQKEICLKDVELENINEKTFEKLRENQEEKSKMINE